MAEVDEKTLARVNEGKIATVVYAHMAPVFRKKAESVIAALKLDYRMGKLDHIKTHALVAELVALEDLETELKGQIARANAAAKSINNP